MKQLCSQFAQSLTELKNEIGLFDELREEYVSAPKEKRASIARNVDSRKMILKELFRNMKKLRSESFLKDFPQMTVTIGGATTKDLLHILDQNIREQTSYMVKTALALIRRDSDETQGEKELRLVFMSPKDLGASKEISLENVLLRAEKLGLTYCPDETAARIILALKSNPQMKKRLGDKTFDVIEKPNKVSGIAFNFSINAKISTLSANFTQFTPSNSLHYTLDRGLVFCIKE